MSGRDTSAWRELATAIYAPPSEGKIYGTLDLDATEALRFIELSKAQGLGLTVTHLMTAALGRALAHDVPELNCFVRRGRVVERDRVDVCVAAGLGEGSGVAAIVVRDADRKPLREIAAEISGEARAHRDGRESRVNRNKDLLRRLPWPLRRLAVRVLSFGVNELGLSLRPLGLSGGGVLGSVMLSNIGTFGLSTGMLALLPAARLAAAVAMGRVEERPVVRDGKVVIRSILPLTGTFDHRIVDGAQAGKLAASVARYLEKPETLEAREGRAPAA